MLDGLSGLLKQAGLSREEVAAKVGVSTNSINNWCSRRTLINLPHLNRLTKLLLSAGLPSDMLYNLVSNQVQRQSMGDEVLKILDSDTRHSVGGGTIFVLGSQFFSGSHQCILLGFHDAMKESAVEDIVYLDTCGSEDVMEYYQELTLQSDTRGVAFIGFEAGEQTYHRVAACLKERQIPCVFVRSGPFEPPSGSAVVLIDEYSAAALATEMLWLKGHRNILALAIDRANSQIRKVDGYCDAMERLGGTPRVLWALMSNSGRVSSTTAGDRPGLREAAEMVASDEELDAVISLSSHSTKELVSVLHRSGRMPASSISLVAVGCWDWMHHICLPPITHVALPYYDVGRRAANLLLSMGDQEMPQNGIEDFIPLPASAIHCAMNGTVTEIK